VSLQDGVGNGAVLSEPEEQTVAVDRAVPRSQECRVSCSAGRKDLQVVAGIVEQDGDRHARGRNEVVGELVLEADVASHGGVEDVEIRLAESSAQDVLQ